MKVWSNPAEQRNYNWCRQLIRAKRLELLFMSKELLEDIISVSGCDDSLIYNASFIRQLQQFASAHKFCN